MFSMDQLGYESELFADLYNFVEWGNELTQSDGLDAKLAIEGLTLYLEPLDITD